VLQPPGSPATAICAVAAKDNSSSAADINMNKIYLLKEQMPIEVIISEHQ
jgi:hypothetical protein